MKRRPQSFEDLDLQASDQMQARDFFRFDLGDLVLYKTAAVLGRVALPNPHLITGRILVETDSGIAARYQVQGTGPDGSVTRPDNVLESELDFWPRVKDGRLLTPAPTRCPKCQAWVSAIPTPHGIEDSKGFTSWLRSLADRVDTNKEASSDAD